MMKMAGRRFSAGAAAVLAVALLAASCGGGTSGGTSVSAGSGSASGLNLGYAPDPNGSFKYQSNVVIIGGGPKAVKAVSSNGLVWTMDGSASGVHDLRPGKIMFASSEAAGKVVKVEPQGNNVAVTLAPVKLTDIVRDGEIKLDQHFGLDSLNLQGVSDLPGAFDDYTGTPAAQPTSKRQTISQGSEPVLRFPAIRLTSAPAGSRPFAASEAKHSFGDWEVTAYKGASSMGLKAERGLGGSGLKVALDAHLDISDLHVITDVPIASGNVGPSNFQVSGITGLNLSIEGGAGNGLSDNRKIKIELPIELKQPVIIGGFPATMTQKFKFLVETAFSAKNGNLTAKGSWSVSGPIGFDGTTLTTPSVQETSSLVESLSGISVGVNGIVAAISFEFGLQVGLLIAGAGPYAKLIASVGLTNGSAIGIVQCKQAEFYGTLQAGVGITVFGPVQSALEKLLGVKIPSEKELLNKQFVSITKYLPEVHACQP